MSLKFRWETKFKETECGEISKDWKDYKFEDIIDRAKNGGTPPTKDDSYWNGTIPWITSENMYDLYVRKGKSFVTEKAIINKKTPITNEGSLLIATRVGIGKVSIANIKLAFNQDVTAIILKRGLGNVEFVGRLLRTSFYNENLQSIASGTTVDGVKREEITSIRLSLPNIEEQTRIATILSWFDELIENKKRQNDILEKSAIAVFRSWFVDFEPVKKNSFKNSELGEIPSSWNIKPIGELADIHSGLSYNGREKFVDPVEGSYVFITLNNAVEGGGFKTEYAWIKSDRLKDRVFLEESDLIIPNTEQTKDERLLGSPGLVVFPDDYKNMKGVFSHHISKISPYDETIKYYLYVFLRMTREDSSSFHTGTGVLGLDIKNFRINKMVIVPPKSIMDKYYILVEPLFQKIINNQKEILVLRKIRDTLLPLLVFGKLRAEEI